MKNLTVKNLKDGAIWCKYGFTVSYSGGKFLLVSLYFNQNFTKLKDLKNKMKNFNN